MLPEAGFLATQLGKGTDGHYLAAASFLKDAGLTLAIGGSITAGKALLIDRQFCGYLASGSTRISLGYVNDQFSRNMLSVKGEIEIAPYFADYAAAMLVTPSAT